MKHVIVAGCVAIGCLYGCQSNGRHKEVHEADDVHEEPFEANEEQEPTADNTLEPENEPEGEIEGEVVEDEY